jgi:hypothetical protein
MPAASAALLRAALQNRKGALQLQRAFFATGYDSNII